MCDQRGWAFTWTDESACPGISSDVCVLSFKQTPPDSAEDHRNWKIASPMSALGQKLTWRDLCYMFARSGERKTADIEFL